MQPHCSIVHSYYGHKHDDVISWKCFPHNWSFVRGISMINFFMKNGVETKDDIPVICGELMHYLYDLILTSVDQHEVDALVPSALLIFCVGNPPVTCQSFDDSFIVNLNKLFNKECSCQWFEMLWCSCDVIVMIITDGGRVSFNTKFLNIYFFHIRYAQAQRIPYKPQSHRQVCVVRCWRWTHDIWVYVTTASNW